MLQPPVKNPLDGGKEEDAKAAGLQGLPVVTAAAKVEWYGRVLVWMKVMGRRKLMAMQV